MEDILARLDGKREDPAALLRRMNSLLGLNDDEIPIVIPHSSSPNNLETGVKLSPSRGKLAVIVPVAPVGITTHVPVKSENSGLKCGWLGCFAVDDAE